MICSPVHIQPEYFLFAHAILRSIPNKLGVVIALALYIFSHVDDNLISFLEVAGHPSFEYA